MYVGQLWAEDIGVLPVEKAVQLALARHPEVKRARLSLELGAVRKSVHQEAVLPQAEAYGYLNGDNSWGESHIAWQSPVGTQFSIGGRTEGGRSDKPFTPDWVWSIRQPLLPSQFLQGSHKRLALFELEDAAAKIRYEANIARLITDVQVAYYTLVYRTHAYQLHEVRMAHFQRLIDTLKARVEAGRLARSEWVQARAQQMRLSVQQKTAEAGLEAATEHLRQVMGLAPDGVFSLPKTYTIKSCEAALTRPIESLIASLPEVKLLALQKEQLQLLTLTTPAIEGAELNLRAEGNYNPYLPHGEKSEHKVGLEIRMPLSHFKKARLQQVELRYAAEDLQLQEQQLLRVLHIRLNSLREQYRDKKAQSWLADENVTLAQQNYRDAEEKLASGRISVFETLRFEEYVQEAELAKLDSDIALAISGAELSFAAGVTLAVWEDMRV